MTATLTRRFIWRGYELTVTNTESGLRYTYPLEFGTSAAGLAFAREAGVGDVRVVELR